MSHVNACEAGKLSKRIENPVATRKAGCANGHYFRDRRSK